MTQKELIAQCKYYKGENKCPFEKDPKKLFWVLEQRFVETQALQKRIRRDNDFRSSDSLITPDDVRDYVQAMVGKWMPYDMSMMDEY